MCPPHPQPRRNGTQMCPMWSPLPHRPRPYGPEIPRWNVPQRLNKSMLPVVTKRQTSASPRPKDAKRNTRRRPPGKRDKISKDVTNRPNALIRECKTASDLKALLRKRRLPMRESASGSGMGKGARDWALFRRGGGTFGFETHPPKENLDPKFG